MTTHTNNHLVIMAGGIGSRFWPMSTPAKPKQFIDVLGCGRSLIQLTYDRFQGICSLDHIWVVTSKNLASIVKEQLPDIPEQNILQEPCMRNTAPCIAYVTWKIKERDPNANLIVSPADHVVMDIPEFQRVILTSLNFTRERDVILTLGMKPNRPETGYGYIEAEINSSAMPENEIYRVKRFHEKPVLEVAKEYVKKTNFYWNSGIFIWNVSAIETAIRQHQPALATRFEALASSFYTSKEQDEIDRSFPLCENISVDYAILEKGENVYVFPASFGWSDLGTWGSLHEKLDKDENGNAIVGSKVRLIESRDCIVHLPEEKRVVIQGLQGYIVSERDNTLLICQLKEEQQIKEFSKEI